MRSPRTAHVPPSATPRGQTARRRFASVIHRGAVIATRPPVMAADFGSMAAHASAAARRSVDALTQMNLSAAEDFAAAGRDLFAAAVAAGPIGIAAAQGQFALSVWDSVATVFGGAALWRAPSRSRISDATSLS